MERVSSAIQPMRKDSGMSGKRFGHNEDNRVYPEYFLQFHRHDSDHSPTHHSRLLHYRVGTIAGHRKDLYKHKYRRTPPFPIHKFPRVEIASLSVENPALSPA